MEGVQAVLDYSLLNDGHEDFMIVWVRAVQQHRNWTPKVGKTGAQRSEKEHTDPAPQTLMVLGGHPLILKPRLVNLLEL